MSDYCLSSMFEKGTVRIAMEKGNRSSTDICTLRRRSCNALWMRGTIIVVHFRVISVLLDIRGTLGKGSRFQKRIVGNVTEENDLSSSCIPFWYRSDILHVRSTTFVVVHFHVVFVSTVGIEKRDDFFHCGWCILGELLPPRLLDLVRYNGVAMGKPSPNC